MALQPIANRMGLLLHSDNNLMRPTAYSVAVIDAAGESRSFIGKVFLEAGSGSKTISSSGGAILW